MFNLGLVRMGLRAWSLLPPAARAARARELADQFITDGMRDEVASVAAPDIVDAMDRLLAAMRDFRG